MQFTWNRAFKHRTHYYLADMISARDTSVRITLPHELVQVRVCSTLFKVTAGSGLGPGYMRADRGTNVANVFAGVYENLRFRRITVGTLESVLWY